MNFTNRTLDSATAADQFAQNGPFVVEPLECRVQLSVSLLLSGTQAIIAGSVVNASADASRWETEMSVVVNPTNPMSLAGFMHNAVRDNADPQLSNQLNVL